MDQNPASPAPAAASPAPAEMPGVGELLSAGTGVTLDNAGLLLGLWAAVGLPPQLLGFIVGLSTGLTEPNSIKDAVAAQNWTGLGLLGAVALVGLVLGLVGYAATILLASRALRGQASSVGDLLVEAVGRMVPVAIASVLSGMAVGFGFILLFLPGLYLMVRLSLAICATIVEESGPIDGLSRSWELVGGRFGETLVFLIALIAVAFGGMIAVIAAGFVLRLLASPAGAGGRLVAGLAVNALQFMISAWAAACVTKFFLELAARKPRAA
jgi:hypothetical protein